MSEKIFHTIKNFTLIWSGICLVLIGLVFIPLPILPGIIIVIGGLGIMAKGLNNIGNHALSNTLVRINKTLKIFTRKACLLILYYLKLLKINMPLPRHKQ